MIDPHHRRILPLSVTLSKLSWGQYPPEIWAGLFRADRMRETFIIPTHIVLTHCLCVCPCLSTTGLNPSMPDITGVWKCVGACALEERCVCHVSASTAANTPTKPNQVYFQSWFSILSSQTVMSQSEEEGREEKKREWSRKSVAEKCSLKSYRAPWLFYKSTTNSTSK